MRCFKPSIFVQHHSNLLLAINNNALYPLTIITARRSGLFNSISGSHIAALLCAMMAGFSTLLAMIMFMPGAYIPAFLT